jgi:hypothetical protein
MANIASICRAGKGTAGKWKVVEQGGSYHKLYHYDHLMLCWEDMGNDDRVFVTYSDIGIGSVSDQQGMNKAFRALNTRFYYTRQGGARID